MIQYGHLLFCFRVASWTNCISQMSDIPTCKTQMKANLAWRSRRLASRKLVRPLLQVILAPGNWMRTPSAFLPAQCTCTQKEPYTRRKGSGNLFLPIQRTERISSNSDLQNGHKDWYVIMIWKTNIVMQQSIGTRQGRNCWKRSHEIFQKKIGFDSSMKEATIALELMGTIGKSLCFTRVCSFSIQSILENGLIAGGKQSKEGRQTIFFTSLNPFGENPDEEAPSDDYTIPQRRKCAITAIGNVIRMPFIV